jgi:Fe-S-cluster containining protein
MKGTESGGKACIALKHSAEYGYRCSIYTDRPSPCREFNILHADGTENEDCKNYVFKLVFPCKVLKPNALTSQRPSGDY